MSILIKGMEMPTGCGALTLNIWSDGQVEIIDADGEWKTSEAVPVPPHGAMIDRDALEKEAQKRMLMCGKNDNQFQKPYEIMRAIALAPTIIPAEEG